MKQRTRFRTRTSPLCAALALAAVLLGACAEQPPAKQEQPAPTPAPARVEAPVAALTPDAIAQPAAPSATPTPEQMPPQPSEARAALERIYKGAVSFDERGGRVVAGDFNGDGSEDIALAVRPAAGKVGELNDELSNWIVSDPRKISPPDPRQFDPHQGVQKLQPEVVRPKIEPNDTLLVVIHGFKEAGWRNPEALQTYLLKSAAGTDLRLQPRVEAQAAVRKKVRLVGDVIQESLGGESGFIYWTGAGYGWLH